jgi:hypothetical protein
MFTHVYEYKRKMKLKSKYFFVTRVGVEPCRRFGSIYGHEHKIAAINGIKIRGYSEKFSAIIIKKKTNL